MPKCEIFEAASDCSVSEIDEDNNQAKYRYKVGIGQHSAPPPYTRNYMPPRADLSFARLDYFVYNFKISKTRTSVTENESIASKSSKEIRKEPKTVRSSAPIIEDWESDSKDERVDKSSTEHDESSNDNSDSRFDWNGMKIQKLGIGFEFNKRACFVCGSVNHLIKDCNFYENKMVEKSVVNNKGKGTGQKKVRPVWNNARRVNHQNFSKMTHPHPKRNFVPTAVATKSGQVLVNAAKQTSAASTSTARPKVNIAAIRTNVNAKSSYFKPHSPKRRNFNQKSVAKTNTFLRKINTANGKNVTTAGPKAVVNAAEGKKENAGNPQYTSQDQEIFDSGCSRHMTGNKSFLTEYQEIDGGFVAFGGSRKGVKLLEKNRVLVIKPHNKTPYELLTGRSPNLEFMRPFEYPVTILNILDHLGKFDGKADEGFLVGYSVNSKAFRVFNSKTRKVKENPHVNFLENKPNVVGSGPEWLFDIDSLTKSMNYEPVTAENQSNGDASDVDEISRNDDVCQANEIRIDSSTQAVNAASLSINTTSNIINAGSLNINIAYSNHTNMPTLEATAIFDGAFDDRDMNAEADTNNLDSSIVGYTQEEGIDYDEVFVLVARIEAIRLFLAYASFKDFIVYQMDVKSVFLYGKIEEEVYVCQPHGFEDPNFPDKVYKVKKTVVANSIIEVEYVAASSCYGQKPTECDGFKQIIDFRNGSSIKYALTVRLTIHTTCIKQFWTTAKVKKVDDEVRIQALVDGKREMDTQEKDKNKAQKDKTKHGMEKIEKDKVIRSQKSKVNPGKVKVKPGKAKAEKSKENTFKG
nr:ribonuclease H-like domain-containing protein [Tanacetum cinerariifolium]